MSKNLFHIKTLNKAIRGFIFPPDIIKRHQQLDKWIKALEKGTLDEIKEVSLHGQFLNDIFQNILGYRSVIDGKGVEWDLHAESTISDGGGSADGALGFFHATENKKGKVKLSGRVIAPIELKAAKQDLDRPAAGRKESAVDQGWRYANYTPNCQWVIVSNYRELRLYQTSKTPAYYEQFYLKDLADLEKFKRFYFLLCRQNFLPPLNQPRTQSQVDILLSQSQEVQEEITKVLYQEYKQLRLDLLQHFRNQVSLDVSILIEKAQKTLDRLLFIAFCEDRGLLPKNTINQACDYCDRYQPRAIWENYKAVFHWVDNGNEKLSIPAYNGGLFKYDILLDEQLQVSDILCQQMKQLTRFDFDTEVSVDILGRIFEQSITDLEEFRSEVSSKRKTQGVFYTPAFITQYIVRLALGGYLQRREESLRNLFQLDKISPKASKKSKQKEIEFWETYRDEVLKKTRIIDPACGSGAFLIAAFDYLMTEYNRVNIALASLKEGQLSLFDLNKTILNNNLYGVDISVESVEITKLSLWLKTAESGQALTFLDNNIKVGNSLIINWETSFTEVFADGGFDVVIGNPPYVRQELLSNFKPFLKENYQCYDGLSDLYSYFFEKGIKILKPDGILSYIVTNKWLRAGYGEALRKFFINNSIFEQIIDFGHAPIFEDADTFPCVVSLRKQVELPDNKEAVLVCNIPREKLAEINLTQYIQQEGYHVSWSRFNSSSWSLERPEIDLLMQKLKNVGTPLKAFLGVKPIYGIKTGLNEAFLIDNETRNQLIQGDNKCIEIIKPYLRGQDIKRWFPEWQNLWMICTNREVDINKYETILNHLTKYKDLLEKRASKQEWWQIEASPDYRKFIEPKLLVQRIAYHSRISFDDSGLFINDSAFIIPTDDYWTLGCLSSALIWWYNWRYLPHMKDDALNCAIYLIETLPIAEPTETIRTEVETIVKRLIEISQNNQQAHRDVLYWLKIEYNIDKLGTKLEDFSTLNCDEFIKEIKKRQPKGANLSIAAVKQIKEAYSQYAPIIQTQKSEALNLEYRLSDLINKAYRLTTEEIKLIKKTAPPRMPIF